MNWSDFWAACALYLVLEGLLPFLNPSSAKRTLFAISQLDERTLRGVGFASMVAGAVLLYFVRGG